MVYRSDAYLRLSATQDVKPMYSIFVHKLLCHIKHADAGESWSYRYVARQFYV